MLFRDLCVGSDQGGRVGSDLGCGTGCWARFAAFRATAAGRTQTLAWRC